MSDDLTAKYRKVFSDAIGHEVLADILVNKLHFGSYLKESLGDVALHNAAVGILAQLGIVESGKGVEIINSLMAIQPKHAG